MKNLLLFGSFGWGEILIIAFVILLLFGGRKIPELMRGIGKGVKSFKDGMKGVEDEIKDDEVKDTIKDIKKDIEN
ncbi:MAG: twin-arginine translocase TatA/TatE family subunit [Bacteroidales bacterium]|jgi:sec-independent protein translocase protein TatA|nr:twin-arginine translocase TatA/TatE family subunit [Bacteroidales bacterium]